MTLREVIDEWAERPFFYGADCCQFVAACVEAVTGENPAVEFRYTNEAEANALIANYGSLHDLVGSVFGQPTQGPYKDGDITVHDMRDGQQIVGIVYRGRSVVRTRRGLMDWPLAWARAVWSV